MAWIIPATWTAGVTALGATIMNNLRDAVMYSVNRPIVRVNYQSASANYTPTDTVWTDTDAANLKVDLITQVSPTNVLLTATFIASCGANDVFFDFANGTVRSTTNTNGVASMTNTSRQNVTVSALFTGLTPASYTFKLQHKLSGGTFTLFRSNYPIVIQAQEL